MIVDLYDAIDRMLWALVFWIAVAAAIATPVLLLAAWAATRVVKRVWRVFRLHARRDGCAPAGAPHGLSQDSGVTGEAPEASSGRTADPGYEEAA